MESLHRVSVAVVRPDGSLVAMAGDPAFRTFIRSAAKPFQAIPVVADGAAARFGIEDDELAVACGSHSSELRHVAVVRRLLARIGCGEDALACGPHRPLGKDLVIPDGTGPAAPEIALAPPSPIASNCSGKHAAMLALARHHGWDTAGYHRAGHPVQQRVRQEVARFCGMTPEDVGEGVDGCGVVAFAMSLRELALGYARLVAVGEPAARRVVGAMLGHPEMVAGERRLCTALMQAYGGRLLAKVGAEGVYAAAVRTEPLGIALKVEDGNGRAAMVALLAVLDALGLEPPPAAVVPQFASLPLYNTRREPVGEMRSAGTLTFC